MGRNRQRAEQAALDDQRDMADAALFAGTPYRDGQRVVAVWIEHAGGYRKDVSRPDVVDVAAHLPAVDEHQRPIMAIRIVLDLQQHRQ